MKTRLGLLLAALFVTSCGVSAAKSANGWYTFNEGVALAVKQGRPVVIDVYTDWCTYCVKMDRETFAEPAVKKTLDEQFIPVKLNAESKSERISWEGKEYSAPDFVQGVARVDGFPTLIFLDKTGKFVTKVPGFVPAGEFRKILDYMRLERYKTQTYEEYLKSIGG